jgi:hypothetical protein
MAEGIFQERHDFQDVRSSPIASFGCYGCGGRAASQGHREILVSQCSERRNRAAIQSSRTPRFGIGPRGCSHSHRRDIRQAGFTITDNGRSSSQSETGRTHRSCAGPVLAFRGFSRSGATISAGILAGLPKVLAEQFSFALAVILTPAADTRELLRLVKAEHLNSEANLASVMMQSLLGAFCAFLVGLLALKWLSRWLDLDLSGRTDARYN